MVSKGTYPQRQMVALGFTPEKIVRAMNRGRRLTAKQIATRAANVSRILRHGNCGGLTATRIARLLELDPYLLQLPRQCWPKAWQGDTGAKPQGAAKSSESIELASDGRGGNLSRRTTPKPNPHRMEILRLVQ